MKTPPPRSRALCAASAKPPAAPANRPARPLRQVLRAAAAGPARRPLGGLDLDRTAPSGLLRPEERLLRQASGMFDHGTRAASVFRAANFLLTEHRLVLAQGRKIVAEFPLAEVARLDTALRPWIAGKRKPQLRLERRDGRGLWVVLEDLRGWFDDLAQLAGLTATPREGLP